MTVCAVLVFVCFFFFFLADHVMSAFYSKTPYCQCFCLSVGYYAGYYTILEMVLTLKTIWKLLKLFGKEESLLHKVSVCCLCAQRTLCDLALEAECSLDCPVGKHVRSKSVLHGTT